MLDVHPPHEPVHGWRDFLLHLFTITVGLLIALSLEGCVEWRHHRHLVHEAEASLNAEIRNNAESLKETSADIKKSQEALKHDVVVLNYILKSGKAPEQSSMDISFHIRGFESLSWKTAQSTGALAYMPYSMAQEYSDIYDTQDAVYSIQQQAARDAVISLAPFINGGKDDPDPTNGEAASIKSHIESCRANSSCSIPTSPASAPTTRSSSPPTLNSAVALRFSCCHSQREPASALPVSESPADASRAFPPGSDSPLHCC